MIPAGLSRGMTLTFGEELIRESTISQNQVGLNCARVESFIMRDLSRVAPYVVVDNQGLRDIDDYFKLKSGGKWWVELPQIDQAHLGSYYRELDFVILCRSKKFEELNGAIAAEGLLVHELAHGRDKKIPDRTFPFFEEAFADYMRGQYLAEHASEAFYSGIAQYLKFPPVVHRFGISAVAQYKEFQWHMPLKYVNITDEKKVGPVVPSITAFTMEVLIDRYPEIRNVFLSYDGSEKSLGELQTALNAIRPGLFNRLHYGTQYDLTSFLDAMIYVLTEA